MGVRSQFDFFRVLLTRNAGAELLLETSPRGACLPLVTVPTDTRTAQELTQAVERRWGLRAYVLLVLPSEHAPGSHAATAVLEAWPPFDAVPVGTQWHPVTSLTSIDCADRSAFDVIERAFQTLGRHQSGDLEGPFVKTGWLRSVTNWVETQAAAAGLRLTGTFRELSAAPRFALLRFETNGPALWFKAVGEPHLHEYSVTRKLATMFPEFVPQIVGFRPDWNAWLTLESEGLPLDDTSRSTRWEAAAETLALLQVGSLGRRFELLEAGCKDLRPCRLVEWVGPFLEAAGKAMESQVKSSPARLTPEEVHALGPTITAAFEELEDAGVPSSLGHLDVNPGNIVVAERRCVFLDWAEAYVGPPFCAFQYLLQLCQRLRQDAADIRPALGAHYTNVWKHFASTKQVEISFKLAPLLAAFTYGAAEIQWQKPVSIRPECPAYLRSLVRRMKREADVLREGRFECAP
jgi:Phosphotransferase enzyme family